MKKKYEAPTLEIERYELDSSIATACKTPVTYSPDDYLSDGTCSEWSDWFDMGSRSVSTYSSNSFVFSTACDCKYSATNGVLFASY